MWVIKAATVLALISGVVQADELHVDMVGGVYHFDRDKVRNGRELNEKPSLKGLAYFREYDSFNAQLFYMNFENSIYQDTHIVGLGVETKGVCGAGIAGGYFIKGYSIPVYAAPYGYCQKDKLRATITGVPTIGNYVDGSVQYKLSYVIKF